MGDHPCQKWAEGSGLKHQRLQPWMDFQTFKHRRLSNFGFVSSSSLHRRNTDFLLYMTLSRVYSPLNIVHSLLRSGLSLS